MDCYVSDVYEINHLMDCYAKNLSWRTFCQTEVVLLISIPLSDFRNSIQAYEEPSNSLTKYKDIVSMCWRSFTAQFQERKR